MPKVISRSTVSTSKIQPSSSALKVYYCLCGEFALVCDRSLSALPIRPLDGSRILRCLDSAKKVRKGRVFKLNATQGTPKLIKRDDETLEMQYPFVCSRCELQIGYEHTPPPVKSGGFTFILPGALTDRQGVHPPDVFLEQQQQTE